METGSTSGFHEITTRALVLGSFSRPQHDIDDYLGPFTTPWSKAIWYSSPECLNRGTPNKGTPYYGKLTFLLEPQVLTRPIPSLGVRV